MTSSSPNLIDLDGDSVLDIVFGIGIDRLQPQDGRMGWAEQPDPPGYVIAVSGANNEVLWKSPHAGEAFTTPRFVDLNGDRVSDAVMGGREGAFGAFSGVDGALLWRTPPASVAPTPVPYNFFTPALVRDMNGDGVRDLVVVYGGNDTRLPSESRDPGYVALISGADGAALAAYATPDGRESYSSVVVYHRADGSAWLIFGTGGETHGGATYRAPVASLRDGSFPQRVERLIAPGVKGTIAPASLVELTGDAELDIVVSTFDGRLVVLNGASGKVLWERLDDGEESYHPAAVMRVSRDGRLGLLISRGRGTFPAYTGSVHRLHDARDGRVLYQYRDPFAPAGAPLAVDLTGDGVDEPFFFSFHFPRAPGARIHVLHGASGKLLVHSVPANLATTPQIADLRRTGALELIGIAWSIRPGPGAPTWRDFRSHLLRFDLSASRPPTRSWAGYMGTFADGHYYPVPRPPPGRQR